LDDRDALKKGFHPRGYCKPQRGGEALDERRVGKARGDVS
jgi:hypothetical protein